jgi:hypothetical protein
MAGKGRKVALVLLVYVLSTALFRARGVELLIDGALLLGFFYYLATLRRADGF